MSMHPMTACISVLFHCIPMFCDLSLVPLCFPSLCFVLMQGFTYDIHFAIFCASFSKDKRFRISLDKWQQWRCGNGTLVPEETPLAAVKG